MVPVSSGAVVYSLGATAVAVGLVVALHVVEPEFDPFWLAASSRRPHV